MLRKSKLVFAQPVHLGFWSGRKAFNGQDVLILKPGDWLGPLVQSIKTLPTDLK
jgi:hypothetical protein